MSDAQMLLSGIDWVVLAAGVVGGGAVVALPMLSKLRNQETTLAQMEKEAEQFITSQQSSEQQIQSLEQALQQQQMERVRLEERLRAQELFKEQLATVTAEFKLVQEELATRSQDYAELETRLEERSAQLSQSEQQAKHFNALAEQRQQELSVRTSALAELKTRLDAERRAHVEKMQALNEARVQLKTEFEHLAQQIFEEKSARFQKASQEGLGHLLNPLREQLGDFRKRVDDVYDREAKDRRSLYEQISQLKQLNQQMSQDAVNLTNALKGESKTQGNWGEVILERVLEESGLRRGHEFEVQASYTTDAGRRYQPDVIVRLPDNKDVIVDAKVSLTAYERYCASTDDAERAQYLREHLNSLRGHIRGLSDKAYQNLDGVRSLDFVLLFVPIEGAFLLALEQDGALFTDAFERNIMLVSPATLLVTLRTIQNIWRYEYQSQNAREIARRGGELHDKFVGFIDAMDDIGRHLERTRQAWETASGRLSSGRGNLVSQAVMLQQLGASAKKKLPDARMEQALADQNLEGE